MDSEDVAPPRGFKGTDFESGSNITLDSFFADMESSEVEDLQSNDDHLLADLESHDDGEPESFGITFSNQDRLPRLPIPKLEETANKLLQFLEALQTGPQQLHAQQQVLEFIRGDGPSLQGLLRQYEYNGVRQGCLGSYIEELWNESHLVPDPDQDDHMAPSSTVNLNNPFFLLEDSPDPEFRKHPIRRAASLTMATLKVASTIRHETFPPDTLNKQPLCMDQYKAVFGAARVPQVRGGDDIDVYPNSTHVVVMCRSQLYYFQAMWPDTGVLAVDEEDLVDILTAVYNNSRQTDEATAARTSLGVLTTVLPRHHWANVRATLSAQCEHGNEQCLTIIDSALFVLVLDDNVLPNTVDEAAADILHGTLKDLPASAEQNDANESGNHDLSPPSQYGSGYNRWYDKLQIIVCGNGTAGINFNNSAIDSHTALRIVSDIYAETVVQYMQSITKTIPSHSKIPNISDAPIERAGMNWSCEQSMRPEIDVLPKKITFDIPDSVRQTIFFASTTLADAIAASDTKVLASHEFGKKFLATHKISPDSMVQMSIILAYYKLYGKLVSIYEPVLTKTFFHGRTEAMRSTIVPAKQLCEVFFDKNASPASKVTSLRRAISIHKQLVRECAAGRGVDRHLYALKRMAERHGQALPKFFHSEPWQMLNHTVILAANCGNPALRLFGMSPIVPDGFGIGYIIKEHSIHFCLNSKRRQTERLANALQTVLKEIGNLLHKHNTQIDASSRTRVLHDIIEEIPEGNVVDNAEQDHTYDMWGVGGLPSPGKLVKKTFNDIPPELPDTTLPAARYQLSDSNEGMGALDRWDHETTEHRRSQMNQDAMMTVPLAPLSDDETSPKEEHRQLRRAPRRPRVRRNTRAAAIEEASPVSVAPPLMPQRRRSMFNGMSTRQALTMEQLNASGASFDFDLSERSDPYMGLPF